MAVDVDTHEIISAEMTLVNVGDSEVLPSLLNPLRRHISEVSGDGAYDTKCLIKKISNNSSHLEKMQDYGKLDMREMKL